MTTEEAFKVLVNTPYFWKRTGRTPSMRRWYLHKINAGGTVRLDTQQRLLESAGFAVETRWTKPR